MAGGRVGEAPTEFYTEASLPRAAIPAQNVDRKSLLALRPRLQAGECLGAVEEGDWGRLSAQKSDNAHVLGCASPLWLGRCQSQLSVSKVDCEREVNRWKLLPTLGNALLIVSSLPPFPCLPTHPAESREGCGDEHSEDECNEWLLFPQVVQWGEPVKPRLVGWCRG